MDPSTMIFFSLLLCTIKDVCYADDSFTELAVRVSLVESEINTLKRTAVNTDATLMNKLKVLESSLKEELTTTLLTPLIKPLVQQAITDIMNDDYIGNMISGQVLDEVQGLKTSVRRTETQVKTLTKRLERDRDTYRKSLRKIRRRLTKDIRALQLRDARMLQSEENQTKDDLFATKQQVADLTEDLMTLSMTCCGVRKDAKESDVNESRPAPSSMAQPSSTTPTTTHPGTTTASNDPSPRKTVPTAPVTTLDTDAPTTLSPATDLYSASRDGDLERVKRIMSMGHLDINRRGELGWTPVMAAAANGHKDVVEFLVGRGADVSLVDVDGDSILYLACRHGDLETVKLILSLNVVDINSRGQWNRTPVMKAAWAGYRDVVELLVSRGANVSLVSDSGSNILQYACRGGDLETVRLILSLNVLDINIRDGGGKTPVMKAAGLGHRDVVELLVGRGADVSLVSDSGKNILHYACLEGHLETVRLILSLNVLDINTRGSWSRTPVLMAAWKGHRDVVELLLDRGADVSLVDRDGNNILHLACMEGHLETVELILSLNKADINARNNNGRTAAGLARFWGRQRVLHLLVSRGAR